MRIKTYIILLLVTLASQLCLAQVKFEAKVSKTKLGVNERLRIDFEMNKDGDNFVPPNFNNFTVVGGPNTSVSNSWINGKRSYKKTYSYFLSPKKRGTFTIKQATIEIEGEIYKTFPVKITVTAAVDKPSNQNGEQNYASDNVHLVAEVSKSNPYLNEAITVVYKLYVSKDTGVSDWREKDNPRYNDFWSQNIKINNLTVERGQYKGEDYRYVVLRKTVLYPQKSGKLKIEPLVLDVTIEVPTNRADIFGRPVMRKVPKTVTAGSRTINVKPLPEAGKPADFKGAVGTFDLAVTTTKKELNATESLQAKVEVSGKGNLKLFELPNLVVPSALEVYEPEHQERVSTNLSGMRGKISDTYTIVPQYKGKYPIPSVSFSYFDLKTETYKRISSKEIIIDVLEGPTSALGQSANSPITNKKQTISKPTSAFAFIKTDTSFQPIEQNQFFNSQIFWLLLLLPFVAIPILFIIKRYQDKASADVRGLKVKKANKLSRKYLSAAKKNLDNKEAFYIALERALHNYLKAKLHIETSDFNKDKISELLRDKKVEPEVVADFITILENCELARYTPVNLETMTNDLEKAGKTITAIDKQLKS